MTEISDFSFNLSLHYLKTVQPNLLEKNIPTVTICFDGRSETRFKWTFYYYFKAASLPCVTSYHSWRSGFNCSRKYSENTNFRRMPLDAQAMLPRPGYLSVDVKLMQAHRNSLKIMSYFNESIWTNQCYVVFKTLYSETVIALSFFQKPFKPFHHICCISFTNGLFD